MWSYFLHWNLAIFMFSSKNFTDHWHEGLQVMMRNTAWVLTGYTTFRGARSGLVPAKPDFLMRSQCAVRYWWHFLSEDVLSPLTILSLPHSQEEVCGTFPYDLPDAGADTQGAAGTQLACCIFLQPCTNNPFLVMLSVCPEAELMSVENLFPYHLDYMGLV